MKKPMPGEYDAITQRCFINAPFEHLRQGLLDTFIAHRLQPEIGLEGDCLWQTGRQEFEEMAGLLQKNNLSCTLHAPFFDLAPGGIDLRILEVTREKLRHAFELIAIFRPRSIVCHLGYDEEKHSYRLDEWLRTSVTTWQELLDMAAQSSTPVMFENTYEKTPAIHRALFERLAPGGVGFCLDVGHLAAYAGSPWQVWLNELLPELAQLHLHDNHGKRDDHIAVGRGCFDFRQLFDYLAEQSVSPLITLEPHTEEDLWSSLHNIDKLGLFNEMP